MPLRGLVFCVLAVAVCSFAGRLPAESPVLTVSGDARTTETARAGGTKVGFVDIEVALDESRAIRMIVGEVDAELGEHSREIERKRLEVERLRRSLEQQGAILSEQERRQRQDRAVALMREIDEMEFRFSRLFQEKQRETIEPLLEAVIHLIADVAVREGFDLVLRGEMVLYGRDTVDLTPLVIREMDTRADDLRGMIRRIGPGPDDARPAGPQPPPATGELLPLIPE